MITNIQKRILYSLVPAFLLTLLMWFLAVLQWGMDWNLTHGGILPRSLRGIAGILSSPLIHGDFRHILTNTPPFLFLGWCLYYFYKEIANRVFIIIWLLTGVFTWLLGREAWHIGASGLIYALAFFLFFSGVFRHNTRLSAVTLIVVFLYGGLIWNMIPLAGMADPLISWEGHLSGALAGLIVSVIFRKEGPQSDPIADLTEEEANDENPYWEIKKEEPASAENAETGSPHKTSGPTSTQALRSGTKEEKSDSK